MLEDGFSMFMFPSGRTIAHLDYIHRHVSKGGISEYRNGTMWFSSKKVRHSDSFSWCLVLNIPFELLAASTAVQNVITRDVPHMGSWNWCCSWLQASPPVTAECIPGTLRGWQQGLRGLQRTLTAGTGTVCSFLFLVTAYSFILPQQEELQRT